MKTKLLALAFCFLISISLAGIQVSGYVTDSWGQPLDQVLVKSSIDLSISNTEGVYRLKVSEPDSVIFHKLGYGDITLPADSIPTKLQLTRLAIEISGRKVATRRNPAQQTVQRIITNSEKQTANESLAGFIAAETGLQLTGTRTAGSQQTLKVPGYDSRHTLVMLDGIPLNRAGEEFDLSRLPLSLIAEIEIISGAGITGSGGMGTVINLITSAPIQPVELETGMSYGSFGHYTANLKYSHLFSRFTWQTDLSYQKAKNDFPYPAPANWHLEDSELTRENNSFWQADFSSFFTYRSAWGDWDFKGYYTDFWRMLPGSINDPALFYKARLSGKIYKGQFVWKYQWQYLDFSLQSWYNQENTIYDNTRLNEPQNSWLYYYIYGKNYKQNSGIRPVIAWDLSDKLNLKLGAEQLHESYKYQETTNIPNSIPKVQRTSQAFFSEVICNMEYGNFSPWLKLAGRYDDPETFSPEESGSVFCGLAYEEQFRLSAAAGRLWGYTLPSFYSLYWQGDAEATGNPDLIPETSSSYKIAASLEYLVNNLNFSWREDKLRDMIIWIENFNHAWKPINIGAARVTNLELSGRLALHKNIQLKGLYSHTISADKTMLSSGQPSAYYNKALIYTPEYQGNIGINWTPTSFNINLNMEFTGSQWTTRDQLTEQKLLAEYQLYNCSTAWDMKYKNWLITWQLKINNLLDEHYSIYEYMPQPGRNYSFSIKIKRG
jgi:outer membrane cobalamin receptor